MLTAHLIVVTLLAAPATAQSTKAELYGLLTDPAGLPIQHAALELRNTSTGLLFETTSTTSGAYSFLALPAGPYVLTATKPGFLTLRRDGLLLRTGDRIPLDLQLSLGDVAQSVEVTAAPPLLQAARGTASFTLDQKSVVTLPLDGRNYVPLIALSPGVSLPPGNLLPRINGSRPRVSEYIYDGVSVLQPEPGQVAFYPIVDAIQEFRVETNSYSAEYGRSNGGVILVNQRSGGNLMHGTIFEFLRNEALNARNLFAAAGPQPQFRRNQYGFVLGGPIRRNRTFFFLDWQGTRLATAAIRTSTIPTTAQTQGLFATAIYDPATTQRTDAGYTRTPFAANTIPVSRLDPAAAALLSRYPAPNIFASGREATANNYLRTGTDTTAQDQFDTRLDHTFTARHRVFARYSFLHDDSNPATPLPDGSGNLTSAILSATLTRAAGIAAEHTWTVSPSAVNQLRFGYTRRSFQRHSLDTGQPATAIVPNIPLSSFSTVLPVFDVTGYQQLGPPGSANARFTTSVTQLLDNYSRTRGNHSLKAGIDIRIEHLDVLQPSNPTGNFQFTNIFTGGLTTTGAVVANTGNSVASFLLGQVTRFTVDAQPDTLSPRARIAESFLQDDWRISRRLTINLGVRHTLNFPSTVVRDRGAVFNLATQRLDLLGQDGAPRTARNLEKANFAPRAGFAWKSTEALVLRSGYGLTWIEHAGITTPFTTPLFPFIQTLGQQTLDNINPAFPLSRGPSVMVQPPGPTAGLGQGVFSVQRDNGSGYAQQWNLSLQKTIGDTWSLEAGYLGSKLTRLGVPDVNLNQLTTAQLALGAQLTQQLPNPYYGEIPANTSLGTATIARNQLLRPYPRFTTVTLYRNNIGHSTYHSLQARLERRLAHGLALTAAYSFSRLIDDAGAVFDSAVLTGPVTNFQAADSFNKRLEKDVSTGNIPHIFSASFVYQLPLGRGRWRQGWQLAGLARIQSGSPLAVTQATNLNAFAGFGIQRPNRIADPGLPPDQQSTARWFNTSAFTQAPQFSIGNSSRNPVTGPPYRTFDLMLAKTIPLSERSRLEFRAEAFNSLNTPPLGNPNGSYGSAAFGTITTALDPRVFECVLKLHF